MLIIHSLCHGSKANEELMIISISGRIGSGKDTVADFLVEKYNFKRYSFAESVKDCLSAIFCWERHLLDGYTKESREFREKVDVWWSNRLGIENFSPRFAMQYYGTNIMRNYFHQEIWIASLECKLKKESQHSVVTDCRFPNEFYSIKELGGTTVRVERGVDPKWYEYARCLDVDKLNQENIHPSEYLSVSLPYDFFIRNDSTLNDLYLKVESFINL